jgi:hypothetical protein
MMAIYLNTKYTPFLTFVSKSFATVGVGVFSKLHKPKRFKAIKNQKINFRLRYKNYAKYHFQNSFKNKNIKQQNFNHKEIIKNQVRTLNKLRLTSFRLLKVEETIPLRKSIYPNTLFDAHIIGDKKRY